jgi:hypothetical protein
VSTKGKVTAKSYGICAITATVGATKYSRRIYVSPAKITAHYYMGDRTIKYYSIAGSKYRYANIQMKAHAEMASDYDAVLRDQDPDFYCETTPKIKFLSKNKISILVEDWTWEGQARPADTYDGFNLYKGRSISLRRAFKSSAKYSAASKNAGKYILSKTTVPEVWRASDFFFRRYSMYYWTKNGLRVVYAATTDGLAATRYDYFVPKSYLKY